MTQNKTFILGLGHQKCGTSWFYEYLAQSDVFAPGFAKEYHIWDRIDIEACRSLRARSTFPGRLKDFLTQSGPDKMWKKVQKHPDHYYDYFASFYSKRIHITADITPSYSGLKAERLENIKAAFQHRGIETKAVIFLRDPLSRIKSAVRFNLDRKNYTEGIQQGEADFHRALQQYYPDEQCEMRTRYDRTISEARKVFDQSALYVGIYENMFTPSEVARLSAFLGIATNTDFAKVKVNKTRKPVSMTTLDSDIRAYYADVYTYCFSEFPATRTLWT